MRTGMIMFCGVVLAMACGCSSARFSSSAPTLRNYAGNSSNRDVYLGWDMRYSLDQPSTYSFKDQSQLTAPKPNVETPHTASDAANTTAEVSLSTNPSPESVKTIGVINGSSR